MIVGKPLPPLNPLPPIAGDNISPASSPSVGSVVTDAALNIASGGAYGAAKSVTKLSVQSIVAILLGLLLIAAGIFSFREVRTTVIATGKTAAKAALV